MKKEEERATCQKLGLLEVASSSGDIPRKSPFFAHT